MSESGNVVVDHCISWATATLPDVDNFVRSPLLTIPKMKFFLKFWKVQTVLGSVYHLDLESDREPESPFDVSVQLVIGTGVVSEYRTTVRVKREWIWIKSLNDMLRVVSDFERRELMFKVVLRGKSTPKKEGTKPALTSLTCSKPSYHTEALSRDLAKVLDDVPSSDVEISCGGQVFKAHRVVLCARSNVFAAMLQSKMAEGKTGRVHIEDVDGDVFGQFLRYLYTGTLPELSLKPAIALYEVADKYAVVELGRACASYLSRGLRKDNACDLLILADRHSDQDFKDVVFQFIMREKVPRMEEYWLDFCNHHPKLANEALNRCCETFFPA